MKNPKLKLVEGIWPDGSGSIYGEIPWEWLTEDAFDNGEFSAEISANLFEFDLNKLFSERLQYGVDKWAHPSKESALETIRLLREYAKFLEDHFVKGPETYLEAEAMREFATETNSPP